MLAGHETTANSISWAVLELCKHPEIQTRLRDEIRGTERSIQERGDSGFTGKDFERMPYLTAVVKVACFSRHSLRDFNRTLTTGDITVPPSCNPSRKTSN